MCGYFLTVCLKKNEITKIYCEKRTYNIHNTHPHTHTRKIGIAALQRLLHASYNNENCLDLSQMKPAGNNATIHCSDLTGCGTGKDGQSWDYQACSQVL